MCRKVYSFLRHCYVATQKMISCHKKFADIYFWPVEEDLGNLTKHWLKWGFSHKSKSFPLFFVNFLILSFPDIFEGSCCQNWGKDDGG